MIPSPKPPLTRHIIHDVWGWNLNTAFDELLSAVARCEEPMIAIDSEFPGFVCEDPILATRTIRYWAMRGNVDVLRPIQFGLAVADSDGTLHGVWTFNLWFDLQTQVYTEEAVLFLHRAGIDFARHAMMGIHPSEFAWRLTCSPLIGSHARSPHWVTFSGWYDWGYLIKLIIGMPMPAELATFEKILDTNFPRRHDLRETLPQGSLDCLMAIHNITRFGAPHTAGSDALGTLELFLRVGPKVGRRALEEEAKRQAARTAPLIVREVVEDKLESAVAVKESSLGDTDAGGLSEDDCDEDEGDELGDVEEFSTDTLDEDTDAAAQPRSGPGCMSSDEAQSSIREVASLPYRFVWVGSAWLSTALLRNFGIYPVVAAFSSTFTVMQIRPAIAYLRPVNITAFLMRNLRSITYHKLSLALSTLSVFVFGCFFLLA